MPAEIIDAIVLHLKRPVDIVACAWAFSLSLGYFLARCTTLSVQKVLESGAPLRVVKDFVGGRHHSAKRMPFDWLLAALRGGWPDVVEWLHETNGVRTIARLTAWASPGAPKNATSFNRTVESVATAAVASGHGPVLSCLLAYYGRREFSPVCLVHNSLILALARAALEVPRCSMQSLLWAIHRAKPIKACSCPAELVEMAKETGRVDVLAWMYDHRCPAMMGTVKRPAVDALFIWAIAHGRLAVAQWAWENVKDPARLGPGAVCRAANQADASNHTATAAFVCRLGLCTPSPGGAKYAENTGYRLLACRTPCCGGTTHMSRRARHQGPPSLDVSESESYVLSAAVKARATTLHS